MEELLQRLQGIGLSADQSKAALNTIKEFIVEKFPMVGGMVDNLFGSEGESNGKGEEDSL
ncbi:MAG: hypothetical protein ABIQ56_01525 [Chitinophagaceae bacterium]